MISKCVYRCAYKREEHELVHFSHTLCLPIWSLFLRFSVLVAGGLTSPGRLSIRKTDNGLKGKRRRRRGRDRGEREGEGEEGRDREREREGEREKEGEREEGEGERQGRERGAR